VAPAFGIQLGFELCWCPLCNDGHSKCFVHGQDLVDYDLVHLCFDQNLIARTKARDLAECFLWEYFTVLSYSANYSLIFWSKLDMTLTERFR
jgi:hypothetical protein